MKNSTLTEKHSSSGLTTLWVLGLDHNEDRQDGLYPSFQSLVIQPRKNKFLRHYGSEILSNGRIGGIGTELWLYIIGCIVTVILFSFIALFIYFIVRLGLLILSLHTGNVEPTTRRRKSRRRKRDLLTESGMDEAEKEYGESSAVLDAQDEDEE